MIDNNNSQQGRHTRPKGMPNKHHLITSPILQPQVFQILRLLIQQPDGRFQQPMVHIPAIKHLHTQPIVQQQFVITLLLQIQTSNS
ncbi:hypothetical protein HanRHA438_Chr12g0567551 [Helianthus annuus]|nr:hypothetical protein HanRHA438_Chr12g0567551 [Helianthus annuus]